MLLTSFSSCLGKYSFTIPCISSLFLSETLFEGMSYDFSMILSLNSWFTQTEIVAGDFFNSLRNSVNVSVSCSNSWKIISLCVGFVSILHISNSESEMVETDRCVELDVLCTSIFFWSTNFET